VVIADGGDELTMRSDCYDIIRDVRCSAEGELAFSDSDDGNGCFGRDALNVTAEINVEHGVADDCNAAALRCVEQRCQPVPGDTLNHRRAS
jgi:hypothetical protein